MGLSINEILDLQSKQESTVHAGWSDWPTKSMFQGRHLDDMNLNDMKIEFLKNYTLEFYPV